MARCWGGPMWIIPSRARPHNLARLIGACIETGMSTEAWIRVDDDDAMLGGYLALDRPAGWRLEIGPRRPLSEVYAEAFVSGREWWGFIADDVVPETPGWDRRLISVAGPDGMAVPAGEGTPHFVLGAELVREIGWLALPGLDRIYIDTVWADIARSRGVLRRVPEVVLRHRHFSNGLALRDATYRKRHKAEDRRIYEAWLRTRGVRLS